MAGTKVKVGAVNYLNTKPLIYAFEQGRMADAMELHIDYPARIAAALINNEIDLGLIPVAVLPQLPEYHIISPYGIACDGPVASVCLFSDVPLEQITAVLVDYQSRTSAALLKILLQEYWNIQPTLLPAYEGYEKDIKGNTAGLVIGDRSFQQRHTSAYSFDLGQAWKAHTGLPFVFAAWVSNKKLDEEFVKAFNEANAFGLQHLDAVIQSNPCNVYDLKKYYTENIKFLPDFNIRDIIHLFLNKIKKLNN
jgi:chorismate dehydratase